MLEFVENASNILKEVVRIKPGQKLLVITDTYARSRAFGTVISEVASSIGVQSVLTIMEPITLVGQEPPPAIAAAMKEVDVVLEFAERHTIVHSNARKEATAVGVRHYIMNTEASEDRLRTPIKPEDLKIIQTTKDWNVYNDLIERHGEGIAHLGFIVDDINKATDYAGELGVNVIQDGAWGSPDDIKGRFACLDTEPVGGVNIELLWRNR